MDRPVREATKKHSFIKRINRTSILKPRKIEKIIDDSEKPDDTTVLKATKTLNLEVGIIFFKPTKIEIIIFICCSC